MRTIDQRNELVVLTEGAVAIALSILLGNIRLVELPNGGSIALATLPLLAFAINRGARTGMLVGLCAGCAHVLAGGTVVHPVQLLLDYPVAYAALGLAGCSRRALRSRTVLVAGIIVAMCLHLAAMVLSGIVFFSQVAGSAALFYALAYNAATVVPETLLALWLVPPAVRAIARANPIDSWKRGLVDPPSPHHRSPRCYASSRLVRGDGAEPVSVNAVPSMLQHLPQPPRAPRPAPSLARPAPLLPPLQLAVIARGTVS